MNIVIISWLVVGMAYYIGFMKVLYDETDSTTLDIFNNNKILYIVVFGLFLLTGGMMLMYDIYNETKEYIRKC